MGKTVFLYSGEGTHSSESGFRLLKRAAIWPQIEKILASKLDLDLEQLWEQEIGSHRCPYSPLLTAVSQICLAELWQKWGHRADVVIGHSTGELAAAYQAGIYSLEDVLLLAHRIGQVAAKLDGVMVHGTLTDEQVADLSANISSYNFIADNRKHVTISGYEDEIKAFVQNHPDFVQMRLPHPWHHPDYGRHADQLADINANKAAKDTFVSGVTASFETSLADDHWQRWLVSPIDFIASVQAVKERYGDEHLDIVEIGFHPVLQKCCEVFDDYTHVSSMFRGEDDIKWILFQRKKLSPEILYEKVKTAVSAYKQELELGTSLAYQGLGSLEFAELSVLLQPYFPSLAPQDFFRYKTIDELIDGFGLEKPVDSTPVQTALRNEVVISGMSCRLPSAVQTLPQFWDMLLSKDDQIKLSASRNGSEKGYLDDAVARFDHQYFNISSAEAHTMDPQQILALELTEMLWKDAGIDPQTLDKERVGVYLGVWNQEYGGDRQSVYYPTGTNPSIIAARISYHYDLRGPSWVSNTACSSSLVAIHYAVKDIEAGRVDYAIAGGVNMLLDEDFTASMLSSGFLSADNRCKTFDNAANGYVRAEGGGLVLLVNKALVDTYYAELAGSAVNQNGGRAQVITAPHPAAQEELISAACRDAGIRPQDIGYVECHGTGTKIGDPIEISAIQNTVAAGRKDPCYVGSVKSNIGHLESAAGIAGLIKSVAILNYGLIPPNLHLAEPNQYIDFKTGDIRVVTEPTPIDPLSSIGVSSFGFGGTNAHIIVKGVEEPVRKEIQPVQIPFDRERALPLEQFVRVPATDPSQIPDEPEETDDAAQHTVTREEIDQLVNELFFQLTSIEQIDPDIELTNQGLDSMSGTELISQLEKRYNVEIGPTILFEYPLPDQFVDKVYALSVGASDLN